MKAFGQSDAYLSLPPLNPPTLSSRSAELQTVLSAEHTLQHHHLLQGWEVVTAACEEEQRGLADNEPDSMHGISSYFNQSKNIYFIEGT